MDRKSGTRLPGSQDTSASPRDANCPAAVKARRASKAIAAPQVVENRNTLNVAISGRPRHGRLSPREMRSVPVTVGTPDSYGARWGCPDA